MHPELSCSPCQFYVQEAALSKTMRPRHMQSKPEESIAARPHKWINPHPSGSRRSLGLSTCSQVLSTGWICSVEDVWTHVSRDVCTNCHQPGRVSWESPVRCGMYSDRVFQPYSWTEEPSRHEVCSSRLPVLAPCIVNRASISRGT